MFETEYKWPYIMVAIAVVAMMGGVAVDSWQKSSCKMEYAKSNRTVEEIREICK